MPRDPFTDSHTVSMLPNITVDDLDWVEMYNPVRTLSHSLHSFSLSSYALAGEST